MSWTSMLAIYALLWSISIFLVLPFHGRKRADDAVPLVAGQDRGAPANFPAGRVALQITIVATVIFCIFYGAYVQGWADPNKIAGRG